MKYYLGPGTEIINVQADSPYFNLRRRIGMWVDHDEGNSLQELQLHTDSDFGNVGDMIDFVDPTIEDVQQQVRGLGRIVRNGGPEERASTVDISRLVDPGYIPSNRISNEAGDSAQMGEMSEVEFEGIGDGQNLFTIGNQGEVIMGNFEADSDGARFSGHEEIVEEGMFGGGPVMTTSSSTASGAISGITGLLGILSGTVDFGVAGIVPLSDSLNKPGDESEYGNNNGHSSGDLIYNNNDNSVSGTLTRPLWPSDKIAISDSGILSISKSQENNSETLYGSGVNANYFWGTSESATASTSVEYPIYDSIKGYLHDDPNADMIKNAKIVSIYSKSHHQAIILEGLDDGVQHLYVWGWNQSNSLGLNQETPEESISSPREIYNTRDGYLHYKNNNQEEMPTGDSLYISNVQFGVDSMIITINKKYLNEEDLAKKYDHITAFGIGSNEFGQLGFNEDYTHSSSPIKMFDSEQNGLIFGDIKIDDPIYDFRIEIGDSISVATIFTPGYSVVFAFGINIKVDTPSIKQPRIIWGSKKNEIVSSFSVTSFGTLYELINQNHYVYLISKNSSDEYLKIFRISLFDYSTEMIDFPENMRPLVLNKTMIHTYDESTYFYNRINDEDEDLYVYGNNENSLLGLNNSETAIGTITGLFTTKIGYLGSESADIMKPTNQKITDIKINTKTSALYFESKDRKEGSAYSWGYQVSSLFENYYTWKSGILEGINPSLKEEYIKYPAKKIIVK